MNRSSTAVVTGPAVSRHKAIAAILLACFLWGTTGTAASFIQGVSPMAIGAFAMGVSGLLMGLYRLAGLLRERRAVCQQYRYVLCGALAVAVYPLAFYSAMAFAGVAVGTVVSIACAPFFSVLLEICLEGKAPSRRWWISFCLCAGGILMLTMSKQATNLDSAHGDYTLGIGLGLLAATTYALYSWAAKSMITSGVSSASAMSVMFLLASTVLLPALFILQQDAVLGSADILLLLYLAVVPMFVGYLAFGYGLKVVTASEATLLTLLEPVIAAVLAVVIVREQLLLPGWLGTAVIMLGLWVQNQRCDR